MSLGKTRIEYLHHIDPAVLRNETLVSLSSPCQDGIELTYRRTYFWPEETRYVDLRVEIPALLHDELPFYRRPAC